MKSDSWFRSIDRRLHATPKQKNRKQRNKENNTTTNYGKLQGCGMQERHGAAQEKHRYSRKFHGLLLVTVFTELYRVKANVQGRGGWNEISELIEEMDRKRETVNVNRNK